MLCTWLLTVCVAMCNRWRSPVAQPLADEIDHLPFALGQAYGIDHRPRAASGGLPGDLGEQGIGQGRREHVAPTRDGAGSCS